MSRAATRLSFGTAMILLACRSPPSHPPSAPALAPVVLAPPDPCAETPIPGDTAAALARVATLQRCDAGLSALAIYSELLRRDPRSRWAYEAAALALAENTPEAARALLQDSGVSPARVGLALLHVSAYEASGQPADLDAARVEFQAALALAPDDPYALCVALRLYLALAARAPERLALATQLCSERWPSGGPHSDRGDPRGAALLAATCARVALESHEPGEARRRFEIAVGFDPEEHGTRLAWGAAELAAGNDRGAALHFLAALAAPGAHDRYLAGLGLGVARLHLHDPVGAEQAYRIAASARRWSAGDPVDRLPAELQFNLGTLLADAVDPRRRAEARALLTAYAERPGADEPRRLRCRQLLLELRD